MSLDLLSDVARASLSDVPNSFYLQADRTLSSDDGVLCSSRRLHGLSRPDTALCPLISRGWRPVGSVRQLRELSHCRQLGSSWSGPQSRCSSIGGQGSPVPTWWATVELRVEPSPTGRPKPCSSHQRPVGPTHACQTAPSEHAGSPGTLSRLLLYTSSRQISSAYFGGDLSLAAVQHSIAFGGYSGFGHFLSSEPFPRTARQQRFTILAKYALRYSC